MVSLCYMRGSACTMTLDNARETQGSILCQRERVALESP